MKHIATAIVFLAIVLSACAAPQQSAPVLQPGPQHAAEPISVRVIGKQAAEGESAGISTASAALQALRDGNERFVTGNAMHPRQSGARRTELASSQKPHTIVLSCSDSRVPPEVVFDQGLGDLFVVRTAGEVADPAAVASIEYAVEHLESKLILVMGHHSCGAVKAALPTPRSKSAGSKDLDRLLSAIRPNLKNVTLETAGEHLHHAVELQAAGAASELVKRSKIVREAVAKHHVQVVQAVYHLGTGEVEILEGSHKK